jgi:hypothetical protein
VVSRGRYSEVSRRCVPGLRFRGTCISEIARHEPFQKGEQKPNHDGWLNAVGLLERKRSSFPQGTRRLLLPPPGLLGGTWPRRRRCCLDLQLAQCCALAAFAVGPMAEKEQKHAHLTKEELAEFREIFNLVDLDKVSCSPRSPQPWLVRAAPLSPLSHAHSPVALSYVCALWTPGWHHLQG